MFAHSSTTRLTRADRYAVDPFQENSQCNPFDLRSETRTTASTRENRSIVYQVLGINSRTKERNPALLSRSRALTGVSVDFVQQVILSVGNRMFGPFLATLSLLLSVDASAFEEPESGGIYPLSRLDMSALRAGNDRRTTHWESRSHSNLDDDRTGNDRDRGHRRISYPLLLDEQSLQGLPEDVGLSPKLGNIFDITDNNNGYNPIKDQCATVIRKPTVLVPFAGVKYRPTRIRDYRSTLENTGRFDMARCRRTIHGWRLQEPVYVEEPRWIMIDDNGSGGYDQLRNDEDPFYVARGKRSATEHKQKEGTRKKDLAAMKDIAVATEDDLTAAGIKSNADIITAKWKEDQFSKSSENKHLRTLRTKRNAFGDALRSSLLVDEVDNIPGFQDTSSSGYVQPRNKHSDILDILSEPFFISRGKKDSLKTQSFDWSNRYAQALADYRANKNVLDIFFPRESRGQPGNVESCDPNSKNCHIGSLMENERYTGDPSSFRDRRGVVEELLKEGDPFYVARGKRSSIGRIGKTNGTKDELLSLSIGNVEKPTEISKLHPSTEQPNEVSQKSKANQSITTLH